MAAYDYGGGCPCGLNRYCNCGGDAHSLSSRHLAILAFSRSSWCGSTKTKVVIAKPKMKVIIDPEPAETIEEFAVMHDLTMRIEVDAGVPRDSLNRYRYGAYFQDAEVKDDSMSRVLRSDRGLGSTPEEAVANYVRGISGKVLVYKARVDAERRDIQVPQLRPFEGKIER
jgi:hypothetical protein